MNHHIQSIHNVIAMPGDCLTEDVFNWHASILSDLSDCIAKLVCDPARPPAEGINITGPEPKCVTEQDGRLVVATRGVVADVAALAASTTPWSTALLVQMHEAIVDVICGDPLGQRGAELVEEDSAADE